MLKLFLEGHVPASQWLLNAFSDIKVIEEFFYDCCSGEMVKFVVHLLETAMRTMYPLEAHGPQDMLLDT